MTFFPFGYCLFRGPYKVRSIVHSIPYVVLLR